MRVTTMMPYQWFEEVCEYLQEDPEFIVGVIEGDRPRLQEFLNKYQDGKKYTDYVNQAIQERGAQAWYDAWAQQWFNIPKMEFVKFQQSNIAELYCRFYARLMNSGISNPKIVDYGCGTAYFDRYLLDRWPKAEITLVDIDSPPLHFAVWRCRKVNPNIKFQAIRRVSDTFPLREDYDLILSYTVLEHVWFAYDTVKHLYEHLQSGGYLIETYSGKTGKKAGREDTQTAWDQRTQSLSFLSQRLLLLKGDFSSSVLRIWCKPKKSGDSSIVHSLRYLRNHCRAYPSILRRMAWTVLGRYKRGLMKLIKFSGVR